MVKESMTFLIEKDLKAKFKADCKENGLVMGKALNDLIEKFINRSTL